ILVRESIVSQNGGARFLRRRRVEKFCPDLQTGGFRVKTHLFWRRDLLSQNHILLEKTLCHRVADIGLDRVEGIRIHDLVASDYLANAVFKFADKNTLAGVAL